MLSRFDVDFPLDTLETQEYFLIVMGTILVANMGKYAVGILLALFGTVEKKYFRDAESTRIETHSRRRKILISTIQKVLVVFAWVATTMVFLVWHSVTTYPSNMYQRFRAFWICVPVDFVMFEFFMAAIQFMILSYLLSRKVGATLKMF
jgi:hypothetical protein